MGKPEERGGCKGQRFHQEGAVSSRDKRELGRRQLKGPPRTTFLRQRPCNSLACDQLCEEYVSGKRAVNYRTCRNLILVLVF